MNVLLTNRPLDIELNCAILEIATRVPPGGFDVAEEAPSTWAELKTHLDSGKRLVVYSGGSEETIYVDPAVNYAFRAWHDHLHYINQFDFSLDGETAVCDEQCRVLATMSRDERQASRWCRIIQAEVIGQKLYHRLYDLFPADQRAFVLSYLENPDSALAARW